MMSLKPVWLVTGATGGVGLALARHLASQGAELLLTARNPLTLEQTAHDLQAWGASVS
ncbi:MAG: SDR family NAD(P)-dependent oxidoreductase, partial [Spirochaetales bacterium]|nr:SDR family NAD(P)-dependent oxidoreductase [Spirochaetales bacterium]